MGAKTMIVIGVAALSVFNIVYADEQINSGKKAEDILTNEILDDMVWEDFLLTKEDYDRFFPINEKMEKSEAEVEIAKIFVENYKNRISKEELLDGDDVVSKEKIEDILTDDIMKNLVWEDFILSAEDYNKIINGKEEFDESEANIETAKLVKRNYEARLKEKGYWESKFVELNPLEKLWAAQNPFKAAIVVSATVTAGSRAEVLYPLMLWNDNGDAFRHAFWNGLMVSRISQNLFIDLNSALHIVETVGINYEATSDDSLETTMDLTNNETGRKIIKRMYEERGFFPSEDELSNEVQKQVDSGNLLKIVNRKIVPTGKNVGWIKDSKGESWFYFNNSGEKLTKWNQINGDWYYLGEKGYMVTGWQMIDETYYYFSSDGRMRIGWEKISDSWYYFLSNGAMATGWNSILGNWYYLDNSGVMQTGWKQLNGNWYYFNSEGKMQIGWVHIGSDWYYMNSEGIMHIGWKTIGGKTYYMESNGKMVTGTRIINGHSYTFNSSGELQTTPNGPTITTRRRELEEKE